jgi:hypothetical protein
MKGGQIRGQGTYGCVFQPALLCRGINKSIGNSGKVGKITSKEDGKNELEIASYVHTIPGSSNYTVIADPKSCTPRARSKQKDKDIRMCDFSKDTPLEKTIQIVMPWGGIPLNQINMNPNSFDFFKFIEHILAIGTFLVLNDLCHMDLWGQNLLFDKENKPRVIDFGFAFRPSKLEIDDLKMRWRVIATDHDTETPEVTLMLGAFKRIHPMSLIKDLEHSKPAVQRLATLCDVLPSEWAAQVKQWSEDSQSFQQGDWLNCWKLYWPGFDAWAIGTILLEILELQMTIPAFVYSEKWTNKGSIVKKVLRGLCCGHPAFRIDAVEALNIFTDGSHSLVSAGSSGSEWISEKIRHRPLV